MYVTLETVNTTLRKLNEVEIPAVLLKIFNITRHDWTINGVLMKLDDEN